MCCEMEPMPHLVADVNTVNDFSLVASALERKLFLVADIQDVGYWVAKIESEVVIHPFIVAYGYTENIEKLIRQYRGKKSPYKDATQGFQMKQGKPTSCNFYAAKESVISPGTASPGRLLHAASIAVRPRVWCHNAGRRTRTK